MRARPSRQKGATMTTPDPRWNGKTQILRGMEALQRVSRQGTAQSNASLSKSQVRWCVAMSAPFVVMLSIGCTRIAACVRATTSGC